MNITNEINRLFDQISMIGAKPQAAKELPPINRTLELEMAALDGMLAVRNKQNPHESSYCKNQNKDLAKYLAYMDGYVEAFNAPAVSKKV